MTLPTVEPEIEDVTGSAGAGGWVVTVFNNEYNTWDEVVAILIRATGCSADEAHMETWEIDNLGKSVVHHGGRDECDRAAQVISTIGIRVTVTKE
ncbi:MAG: ATP-dependent Clp protease adaptor ClpS [Armatimonadota bacterium]|nr:ATP-dependent Clp protease adaptor ClpS [Armatimonadota bacterium]